MSVHVCSMEEFSTLVSSLIAWWYVSRQFLAVLCSPSTIRSTVVIRYGTIVNVWSSFLASCFLADLVTLLILCFYEANVQTLACGYTFTAFSKEGPRFRWLLITFLFITITLNLLVTLLMGTLSLWSTTLVPFGVNNGDSSWSHMVDSAEGSLHFRASTDFQIQYYDCNHVREVVSIFGIFSWFSWIPHPFQQSGIRHYLLDICRTRCGLSSCVWQTLVMLCLDWSELHKIILDAGLVQVVVCLSNISISSACSAVDSCSRELSRRLL